MTNRSVYQPTKWAVATQTSERRPNYSLGSPSLRPPQGPKTWCKTKTGSRLHRSVCVVIALCWRGIIILSLQDGCCPSCLLMIWWSILSIHWPNSELSWMNQCANPEWGVKVLIYKAVLIAVQVSFEAWVAGGLEGPWGGLSWCVSGWFHVVVLPVFYGLVPLGRGQNRGLGVHWHSLWPGEVEVHQQTNNYTKSCLLAKDAIYICHTYIYIAISCFAFLGLIIAFGGTTRIGLHACRLKIPFIILTLNFCKTNFRSDLYHVALRPPSWWTRPLSCD